jgi:hypothetical protein
MFLSKLEKMTIVINAVKKGEAMCLINYATCHETIWGSRRMAQRSWYGLVDRGVGVRVPVSQELSLLQIVQTGSEAHPTSYPMGTGGKAAGACI